MGIGLRKSDSPAQPGWVWGSFSTESGPQGRPGCDPSVWQEGRDQ